jgi:hypothetical protein
MIGECAQQPITPGSTEDLCQVGRSRRETLQPWEYLMAEIEEEKGEEIRLRRDEAGR